MSDKNNCLLFFTEIYLVFSQDFFFSFPEVIDKKKIDTMELPGLCLMSYVPEYTKFRKHHWSIPRT